MILLVMEYFFFEHAKDLSDRSETRGIFTFSAFLSPEEQSMLLRHKRELTAFSLFGGTEDAERRVARFGSPEKLGYEEPWNIVCLHVYPRGEKFAEPLTHRDYLGALLGTGLERGRIGDIAVRGNGAYVFTDAKTAAYLCEELREVRRTAVNAALCETPPAGALYETRTVRLNAASLRLDCICGAAFRLSRTAAAELFRAKKVFLNHTVCEHPDRTLKENDVVSVRGYGKFRFTGQTGETKKGRAVAEIELYV